MKTDPRESWILHRVAENLDHLPAYGEESKIVAIVFERMGSGHGLHYGGHDADRAQFTFRPVCVAKRLERPRQATDQRAVVSQGVVEPGFELARIRPYPAVAPVGEHDVRFIESAVNLVG